MLYLVTSHHKMNGSADNSPLGLFADIESAREYVSVQLPGTVRSSVQHVHCTTGEPGEEGFEETWNGYHIKGMVPILNFVASASIIKMHQTAQVALINETNARQTLQGLIK